MRTTKGTEAQQRSQCQQAVRRKTEEWTGSADQQLNQQEGYGNDSEINLVQGSSGLNWQKKTLAAASRKGW